MKIEIDFEKITEYGLDAHLYCILYCVYYKHSKELIKYLNSVGKPNILVFKKLSQLNFIKDFDETQPITVENLELTDNFKELILSKGDNSEFENLFLELYNTYPASAGIRRLRGEKDNCKTLYKKIIVKNKEVDVNLHNSIILALKREIQERNSHNELKFMKQLIRYIRTKGWEEYQEEVSQKTNIFRKII